MQGFKLDWLDVKLIAHSGLEHLLKPEVVFCGKKWDLIQIVSKVYFRGETWPDFDVYI